MRNRVLAGNWKMNMSIDRTKEFFADLIPLLDTTNKVVVCVPYTLIATAVECTKGTDIAIGAENAHWANSGAFTGEISADMLCELGVQYVIVGHSERRQYFGETDETVCKRAKAVLSKGLTPIVCIGETLEQRNSGKTEQILKNQIKGSLQDINTDEISRVIIAYEPIWAIGTGVTATSVQAQDTIAYVRSILRECYGNVASNITIQYGGSMNDKNAQELLSMPDIDGGLIGGASLVATKFATIANTK